MYQPADEGGTDQTLIYLGFYVAVGGFPHRTGRHASLPQIRRKSFRRYIQKRIRQKINMIPKPYTTG